MDAASNTADLFGLIRQDLTEKEIVAQRAKGRKIMDSRFCSGGGRIVPITDMEYTKHIDYEARAPGEHYKYLEEFAISVDETWERHCIFPKNEDRSDMLNVILEMLGNHNQGVILVRQSWNKGCDLRKDGNKLRWTDMVMSNFCAAAPAPEPCKNLKYIVRDNVLKTDTTDGYGVEPNTVLAMEEAFRKLDAPRTKTLRLDHRSTKTDEIAMFEFLAAQAHVARVYQMIQSFPIELAGKNVSALHLQHKQHSSGCSRYNIIIELGQNEWEEL